MIAAGEITTIQYLSWNASTNEPELNDAGNHALSIVKDGVESPVTNSPASLSAGTNKIELTALETAGGTLIVGGVSSTPDVYIIPVMIITNQKSINAPLVIGYTAWDKTANAPKTGDDLNHTLYVAEGGVEALATSTPSEVNDVSLPGLYILLTTLAENGNRSMAVYGTSSTADVNILQQLYSPDPAAEPTFISRPEVVEVDTEIEVIEPCSLT